MTNQAELINYQAEGEEQGFGQAAANAANAGIAAARNATPQGLRALYRSYIIRGQCGYLWGWVLKD